MSKNITLSGNKKIQPEKYRLYFLKINEPLSIKSDKQKDYCCTIVRLFFNFPERYAAGLFADFCDSYNL